MRTFTGLFWKFTGALLFVLFVGAVIHAAVWLTLVRPLADRWANDRTELAAREIAADLRALPDPTDEAILGVLSARVSAPQIAVFVGADGEWIASDRLAPPIVRMLDDGGPGRPRPGPPPRSPRGRRGGGPEMDRGRPPLVVRVGITDGPLAGGRVVLIHPGSTDRELRTLFVLPLALLVAGLGALVLVRMLVGRIRGLEALAARVEGGDLTARVDRPGTDEIGQLGQRMNTMIESLGQARARIERNEQERRRLLGDIAHEFATPLTSIRGFTETLLDPAVGVSADERSAYLQDVLTETKRLDLLVQELLDLTRLEAAGTRLDLERIDLAALTRHTVERFRPSFRLANVDLAWDGPADGATVEGDGRRLEQVVENLLMNARRYVPAGGHVAVGLVADRPVTGGEVILTVEDDGPGFAEADLPRVFDRFYRGDPNRSTPGSGLGLAIVQEIVRLHGGTVEAANRETGGARLIVRFPGT